MHFACYLYVYSLLSHNAAGVGCHALLYGIFPTQGLNPHVLSSVLADGFFTTSATWEGQTPFWDWANFQILM